MGDGADDFEVEVVWCQGRATEVGSGDPCRLKTRVDQSGRRFIALFVEFFNRHLWPSRVDFKAR